ncbi:hypothetical protein AGMMS49975_17710 [Clostridia bacterium]|nr:hypothetical protein AGMMS49975_17710 [Clostridia bacterium]
MEREPNLTFEDFKQAGMSEDEAKEMAGYSEQGLVSEVQRNFTGTVYRIEHIDGGVIGEYETDEDGNVFVPLKPGVYKMKQIAAADGFTIDKTTKVITIRAKQVTNVDFHSNQYERIFLRRVS